MWQALREELHPQGLEIVTVGMDTAGPEACRPFIEADVDLGERCGTTVGA